MLTPSLIDKVILHYLKKMSYLLIQHYFKIQLGQGQEYPPPPIQDKVNIVQPQDKIWSKMFKQPNDQWLHSQNL